MAHKLAQVGNKSVWAGKQVVQPLFLEASTGNAGVCYVSQLYLSLMAPVLEPSRAFFCLDQALIMPKIGICNVF